MGLKKGPWTSEEDQQLAEYIKEHGHVCWRTLPNKAGLQRCGQSCRLRWRNYLRPDIKRGKFSLQEEQTIIKLHALLGNRWAAIATHLPRRTDNEIKNYWNTVLRKRLTKMGIDPVTHKSIAVPANLIHMTQWENARLEAEARLARRSNTLVYQQTHNTSSHLDLINYKIFTQPLCLDVLKQSYMKGPRPVHISTSSLPYVHNQSITTCTYLTENTDQPSYTVETASTLCMNDCEILKEPFNTLDISKEANMIGVTNIVYQGSHVMEALTYPSANDTNNEIHGNNDCYWIQILSDLENNSSSML